MSWVALAAVAVAGTAAADVTLSGKLRFAYEADKASNTAVDSVKTNGLTHTDGDFRLTATEDLGGGLTATARMEIASRGRGTGIDGRDASITLAGGFGSVMIGAVEAGNGIIGLGGAGAPVYGMDDFSAACATPGEDDAAETSVAECGVLDGGSNVNILSYTSPSFNGFTFTVNTTDATGPGGMQSAAPGTDARTVGLRYAAGPLAAAVDTTRVSQNDAADTAAKSRTRMSASYDLGMVKLGFGYQTRKSFEAGAEKNKQTLFGVSAPVASNITVGMNYATQKQGDAKVKGTDLGVQYDLSKRTYVAFHTQRNKANDAANGGKYSKYRIQLSHAF